MDFFKSCRTNVQHTDDIWKTPTTSYTIREDDHDVNGLPGLLASLHASGASCALTSRQLWVFGSIENTVSNVLRKGGLELDQRGTLETFMKGDAQDGPPILDSLFDAIESTVSYVLLQTGNVTKLNFRTWLFLDDDEEEDVMLRLSMRVAEDGKLSIATSTVLSHLRRLNPSAALDERVSLTLAPTGCRARWDRDDDHHASDREWRALVTKHLFTSGISTSNEDNWVKVQLIDRPCASIEWPAKLCFEQHRGVGAAVGDTDWKQFFIPTTEETAFKHPLEAAEEWCKNAAFREQQSGGDGGLDSSALPTSTLPDNDSMMITSPPFLLRNAEQQAAASGIYPTPPDGIVPGQLSSQQHSSDAMAIDNVAGDSGPAVQDFSVTVDDPTSHLRASSVSDPAPTFNAEDSSNDLFGDMGGEMDFGSGEIGDADFDFFNEEDGVDPTAVVADMEEPMVGVGDVVDVQPHQDEDDDADISMAVAKAHGDSPAIEDHNIDRTSLSAENAASLLNTADRINDTIDEMFPDEPEAMVKPLSPFAIKERLLPPPIPASVRHDNGAAYERRTSRFDAITFKENLNIGRKFSELYGPKVEANVNQQGRSGNTKDHSNKISVKVTTKAREYDDERSESEDGSSESVSSPSDVDVPPKAPWSSKKRKRSDFETNGQRTEMERLLRVNDNQPLNGHQDPAEMKDILDCMLGKESPGPLTKHTSPCNDYESLSLVEELLHLSKMDLVFVAQLVVEQAVTCTGSIVEAVDMLSISKTNVIAKGKTLHSLVDQALTQILPSMTSNDIASLALARESLTRNPPTPATPRPGQPRPPPPRSDNTNSGPDIVAIPPPYVRVQRGNDKYEMLPPALQFWDTLSLAPVNGAKDIRAFCVFPGDEGVQNLVETFLDALGTSYDECKLGSHTHSSNGNDQTAFGNYVDGLVPVDLKEDDDPSLESAIQSYSEACTTLGTFMANIAYADPERTFVVYIINPFRQTTNITHHLCACFWHLYQAYRRNVPRNRGQSPSDIMLQILPIDLLAASENLIILSSTHLTSLSQEIYDRCPPTPSFESSSETASALPNYIAPLFELATPPPKRISFQLSSEVPSDLLHEGSCLHLAYALSPDGFWLTAAWVDNTGRYQSSTSFPLCGRRFADVVEEVWERTREIMSARAVTWRIFVVTGSEMEGSVMRCWRGLVERPRKQAFSVTLLRADLEPVLELSPPPPPPPAATGTDESGQTSAMGAGSLTPGSTPQGTTITVSPDPSGSVSNLPPTPAPSDSTPAATGEADSDAHLVDLTDETWAVLFSSTTSQTLAHQQLKQTPPLCTGALYKRGDAELPESSCRRLPSLGVALHWTIQVRPSGAIDEGNARQAEMTLREVLRMYRNLSVLSRARGLVGAGGEELGTCVPVHLCTAVKGARALDRFSSLAAVKT